jgi:hypothetical protein
MDDHLCSPNTSVVKKELLDIVKPEPSLKSAQTGAQTQLLTTSAPYFCFASSAVSTSAEEGRLHEALLAGSLIPSIAVIRIAIQGIPSAGVSSNLEQV